MVTSHLLSMYIVTKYFFSDEEGVPGWKVVLRTEVRGRRVDSEMEEHDEIPMFAMGADSDFQGLHVPEEVPESNPDPLPLGRNVRLNEVLNEVGEEEAVVFDRDLGESSEEGE